MESLFTHLGIDWRLLVAQGVNFFLLVLLLNYFLYKPLVKLINERRQKIEQGLSNAKEAEDRLREAEVCKQEKIVEGEKVALAMIVDANKDGEVNKKNIIKKAEMEAEVIKQKSEDLGRRLIQREIASLQNNARELVEKAIFASVRLHPEEIDKRLIDDAVGAIKVLKL